VTAMLQPEASLLSGPKAKDMNDNRHPPPPACAIFTLRWATIAAAGGSPLRAYVSPLAPLIWLGGLVMALGRHPQPLGT